MLLQGANEAHQLNEDAENVDDENDNKDGFLLEGKKNVLRCLKLKLSKISFFKKKLE